MCLDAFSAGRTWTGCAEGELMEDSGGAVNRDTVAGWSPGTLVDVALEAPSASFWETFPTAAFRECRRSGKREGQRKCDNNTKVQLMHSGRYAHWFKLIHLSCSLSVICVKRQTLTSLRDQRTGSGFGGERMAFDWSVSYNHAYKGEK
jgi:hypothetical protein